MICILLHRLLWIHTLRFRLIFFMNISVAKSAKSKWIACFILRIKLVNNNKRWSIVIVFFHPNINPRNPVLYLAIFLFMLYIVLIRFHHAFARVELTLLTIYVRIYFEQRKFFHRNGFSEYFSTRVVVRYPHIVFFAM